MKLLLRNNSGCSHCVIELHSFSLLALVSEPAAYGDPHFHTVQVSPSTVTLCAHLCENCTRRRYLFNIKVSAGNTGIKPNASLK